MFLHVISTLGSPWVTLIFLWTMYTARYLIKDFTFITCFLFVLTPFLFFWGYVFLMQKPVILDYLASKKISSGDLVVVSPDVGGVARARAFAKKLSDAPLAIVDKRRQGHNVAEVLSFSN